MNMQPGLFSEKLPDNPIPKLAERNLADQGLHEQYNAVLYLFSPRNTPDQFRRPYLYRFGQQFQEDLYSNVERALNAGSSYNWQNAFMPESLTAKQALLPEAQGSRVELSRLSPNWTFVLIVDNSTAKMPFHIGIPSRLICSGYFTDDPTTTSVITSATPGQRVPLNPNAILFFTHHTYLTQNAMIGPNGGNAVTTVSSNYDYLPGFVEQEISENGNRLQLLRPTDILNSLNVIDTNNFNTTATPLQNVRSSVSIDTNDNAPASHLQNIVAAAADTMKNQLSEKISEPMTTVQSDVSSALDSMRSMTNYQATPPIDNLDFTRPWMLSELELLLPNMNVQRVLQPHEAQYGLTLADAPTKRNVANSIMEATLPHLLASLGLADVQFRYASYAQDGIVNRHLGMYRLMNISAMTPLDDIGYKYKWERLQNGLDTELWPIIRTNFGDFDVMIHCSVVGITLINLILLDENRNDQQGLVETNNFLGGLNTPLLGSPADLKSNQNQLYGAVNNLFNTVDMHAHDYPVMPQPTTVSETPQVAAAPAIKDVSGMVPHGLFS